VLAKEHYQVRSYRGSLAWVCRALQALQEAMHLREEVRPGGPDQRRQIIPQVQQSL